MDGLVSTGNKFPSTILEINFFNQKKIPNYFINILKRLVDKPTPLWCLLSAVKDHCSSFISDDQ